MMNLGSTEAIKRSVAAGVGVAFVSRLAIAQELDDRRLATCALRGFRLQRALHVVQSPDQTPSAAVRAFLALLPPQPPDPAPQGGASRLRAAATRDRAAARPRPKALDTHLPTM